MVDSKVIITNGYSKVIITDVYSKLIITNGYSKVIITDGYSKVIITDEQYASGYTSTKFLTKCGLTFENLWRVYCTSC